MRRQLVILMMSLSMTLAFATHAGAQEFALQVGPPIAGATQPSKKSIFVVRPGGCPDPARAQISANAEGIVEGQRRTIPLTLMTLETPGVRAIPNEWAKSGMWVINLVGTCEGKTAGAIVAIGSVTPFGTFRREGVKLLAHRATPAEIDAALKTLTTGGQK